MGGKILEEGGSFTLIYRVTAVAASGADCLQTDSNDVDYWRLHILATDFPENEPMRRSALCASLFALLAVLAESSPAQPPKADATTEFINQYFANQWKAQKLTPAERTTDEEFLRRVSLDLLGRIATAEEVRAFVKDAAPDKRAKLVDKFLASPEFVTHRATLWTNWLLPRGTGSPLQRQQLQLFLEEANGKLNYQQLVEQLIAATGKTNDNGAVNFLIGNLGTALPADKQAEDGYFDMVPATTRVLRLFLGYRLSADQLPDHPFHPDFKPEQFWGVNAFLRQAQRYGANSPLELKDNPQVNTKGLVTFQDKEGKKQSIAPVFLDGKKLPADSKKSRRQVLAELVTNHPNFAKAYANRMWGHFFGRGLNERPAVDDFGSHNKVVHPELLDRLAQDLVAAKYDPRPVIRAMCASDVYQLRSTTNATNGKEDQEVYFSRMPLKLLTPEQVTWSALTLLGRKGGDEDALRRKLSTAAAAHIGRRVGDSTWEELPVQDRIIINVSLLNLREVNDAILTAADGPVSRAVALKDPAKVVEEMYVIGLNRRPTEKEAAQLKTLIDKEAKDLTNVWQDLFWALINSSEFILNH